MFDTAAHTLHSIVRFSNNLSEHALNSDTFFDQSLLKIIETDLGVRKSLIVIHGSEENDYRCCAWIDKRRVDHEMHKHPYWHFSRQDRCANHINDHCRRIDMSTDSVQPLLFRSSEIITNNDYHSSDYALWLRDNMGQRYHYSLHLPFGSHGRYHLCFYKSRNQSDFSDRELDLVTALYSLVASAYRTFEHHSILKTFNAAKSEMLEKKRLGYVILDSRLNVLDWNRAAADLLAANGYPVKSGKAFQELLLAQGTVDRSDGPAAKKKLGDLVFSSHSFLRRRPHYFDQIFYCLTIDQETKKVATGKPDFGVLTARENEITDRLSKGLTNREVADVLYLSPHTVRNHVQNIFQKLEIKNQKQLVGLYTQFAADSRPLPSEKRTSLGNLNRDKIICFCQQITAGDIEAHYHKGLVTVKALMESVFLGRMCRNCLKEAADLIKLLSESWQPG